ncbi:MAG: restriction endonuclease subunit S [Kofleriaceae bacterium]|nr:restriction endonuclease subunit S [Kofleriaceae bacterium]MBP9168302.1 restriction endonuclease subunit S [Kofleriaceae bacterium]MBP9857181.1 restriction endonuclease subunit S [Kofleriaceae bacterium]
MTARREAPLAVPWLGNLRANWPLVPLRYLVRFLSGGTPDKGNADFWSGGTIPWVSPKDMKVDRIRDSEDHITEAALDSSATQVVPVGSVLVVVRGMILAHTLPVAVTVGSVTINQDIKALVCGERIMPEFLHAVLAGQAEWLLSQADSSAHGTKKLETEVLQRFEVPCPPLQQQRRIVATMQAQAMRLDEVAAAKQRLLDLLVEKRKAIIATAVTRGLDPQVNLRDSGVPWLGEIPVRWESERARWLFRERDVRSTTGDEEMLTVSHLTGVTPRSEKEVNMFEAETNEGYKLCEPGDLVINTLWAWMGAMGTAPVKGIVSPAYNVYEPCPRFEPTYIDALVRLPVFAQEVTRYSKGVWSSRLRLYPEGFFEVYLPVPPLDEQRAIVSHIARETAKLDAVRAATERTIALLKERRSALIAAAVTGQLEVGSAA